MEDLQQDEKFSYSRESIPLVRLRNPHGNGKEWAGDWSDTRYRLSHIPCLLIGQKLCGNLEVATIGYTCKLWKFVPKGENYSY